jgi:trehalose 6-phosphate synthase/phosphatase
MKKNVNQTRLVVVSNRLPVTLRRENKGWQSSRSAGGLATAMDPILARTGGIWIGWTGDNSGVEDAEKRKIMQKWRKDDGLIAVDLPPEIIQGFYEGFSNETLWFLFHHFPGLFTYDAENWRAYVRANETFCKAVLQHLRPNDLIWIHDYQLMLLPQMIREAVPDAKIGFFLHIPFPSSDVFRVLPHREEILGGLLGADYVAFHTHQYLQNFRTSLMRILGLPSQMDGVHRGNRRIRLEAQPIGIAPEEFTDILKKPKTVENIDEIRRIYKGLKIFLGVDRVDYTKGIPERLRAYRQFLRMSPKMRRKVVLIQVAVPSRERIPLYQELQREVDELVGQINGEFGTPNWSPIIYMRRNISREELAALYAMADVALVTPLRDGLNLVGKEFVACQPDGEGVLILSEFAGAAAEMGEAFQVNPYDAERTAETISRALNLPAEERRERMNALFRRVHHNNVYTWGERFITNLRETTDERTSALKENIELLPEKKIVRTFHAASKRLLLLDYDGTLVPYANRPQDAVPPPELWHVLAKLSGRENISVMLVSGRAQTDLDSWFGTIRGLWLAAEHGAVIRSPETKQWQSSHPNYSDDWKKQVFPVLEHFTDRTPGSFIEEKQYSLVWHYRMADPEFGEWLANELASTLEQLLAETQLRAVQGQKTVEVKLIWANKAQVLNFMMQTHEPFDFVLAAGDDTTDEDLFAEMSPEMWTVRIGGGNTRARFHLADYKKMRKLLNGFAIETQPEKNLKTRAVKNAAGK